jgi:hypothetical protein
VQAAGQPEMAFEIGITGTEKPENGLGLWRHKRLL